MPFQALPFVIDLADALCSVYWPKTVNRIVGTDTASARTISESGRAALFFGSDVHRCCRSVCRSSHVLSAESAERFRSSLESQSQVEGNLAGIIRLPLIPISVVAAENSERVWTAQVQIRIVENYVIEKIGELE